MTDTSSPRWNRRPKGSNWGEFGEDDELGRINLLTAERVCRAAQEIQEGRTFCLSLPLNRPATSINSTRHAPRLFAVRRDEKPMFNLPTANHNPHFTDIASDDVMVLSSQYSTQWDAFAHVGHQFDADGDGLAEPLYYNGWRAEEHVVGPPADSPYKPGLGYEGSAAHRLGIDNFAVHGMQGRGVLVDFSSRFGREYRPVGYDDLMRIFEEDKVEVETGDILCLYTGWTELIMEMGAQTDTEALGSSCVGLDGRDDKLLRWISDSGIAAIAADNYAVEYFYKPGESEEMMKGCDHYAMLPLHEHCLFKLGIPLGELWYFGELAAWLRANNRTRFFLTAPPLRMPGAVGSPVTPIATV
jgi:kynurenine formamidase